MTSLPPAETSLIPPDPSTNSPHEVSPIAYRIAAGILLANLLLGLFGWLLGYVPNLLAMLIDAALIIGLFQIRSGARSFTLFRAYAGAVLMPILSFFQNGLLVAVVTAIIQFSYSGSLILLLQGETRKWKIYTAIALFVFLTAGINLVVIGLSMLSKNSP